MDDAFKFYIDDYGYINYYRTTMLPSGQTARIEFNESCTSKGYYFSIWLVLSDKRKGTANTYLKSTGKDGLKGLLWAKQNVIDFEEFIKEELDGYTVTIYTQWDDNRRRDTYHRGLSRLGYRYDKVFGCKALSKIVCRRKGK